MKNAGRAKPKTALFFVAYVVLLILAVSASAYVFTQEKGSAATGNSAQSSTPPPRRAIAPAVTPTDQAEKQSLFEDNFTTVSKGWYVGSVPGYTRKIAKHALMLADTNHTILPESLPATLPFKDFRVIVTFTIVQATKSDSAGIYVRGDNLLEHDYRIDVFGNRTYAISKELLDASKHQQVQYLVGPESTNLLKPTGQPNTLCVMMKGPRMVLELNGRVVDSLFDDDYASGQIALFVQNSATSSGVAVSFHSVAVFPAPQQLPTH
jgi:Domain of Unknown Function (DUF1080)